MAHGVEDNVEEHITNARNEIWIALNKSEAFGKGSESRVLRFRYHFAKAIYIALCKVCGEKNTGYNSCGIQARDYWKHHGVSGLAYEIHKKGLRAVSVSNPDNVRAGQLSESLADTAWDLINYAGFLYSELMCRQEESKEKES